MVTRIDAKDGASGGCGRCFWDGSLATSVVKVVFFSHCWCLNTKHPTSQQCCHTRITYLKSFYNLFEQLSNHDERLSMMGVFMAQLVQIDLRTSIGGSASGWWSTGASGARAKWRGPRWRGAESVWIFKIFKQGFLGLTSDIPGDM